jgi:hypothetical protein
MQYHQVRRLVALKDKIMAAHPAMSPEDAEAKAKERADRLGIGSAILFDLDVEE